MGSTFAHRSYRANCWAVRKAQELSYGENRRPRGIELPVRLHARGLSAPAQLIPYQEVTMSTGNVIVCHLLHEYLHTLDWTRTTVHRTLNGS